MSLFDEKPGVGLADGQDVAYRLNTIPAHRALWVSAILEDFGLVPVGVKNLILRRDDRRSVSALTLPSINQAWHPSVSFPGAKQAW